MVDIMKLSMKDYLILEQLAHNAKQPVMSISKKINIPVTTVHHRIKKMEEEGIIQTYKAIIDNKKIGKSIEAIIQIVINYSPPSGAKISQENIAKNIRKMKEVEGVYILTGASDILIRAAVKDVEDLNDFVINRLRNIEGVDKTTTSIILKSIEE